MNGTQIPNQRKRISPEERRKRRIKRKIKIIALFVAVALVVAALVWGLVALLGSIGSEESSAPESSISTNSQTSAQTGTTVDSSAAQSSDETSTDISEESSAPVEEEIPWNLILVNGKNHVPDNFVLNLAEVEGETIRGGGAVLVDARVTKPLQDMLTAARADGILPKVTSAYRSIDDQIAVMEEYINDYMDDGMTREEAEAEARNWVATPGASEHHTGLAVDISTADWGQQGADVVWAWLEENCWKYGFILRYTEEWASVTGTSPEPWHFRYVGTEHAKAITDSGLPYEQYYEQNIEANCNQN